MSKLKLFVEHLIKNAIDYHYEQVKATSLTFVKKARFEDYKALASDPLVEALQKDIASITYDDRKPLLTYLLNIIKQLHNFVNKKNVSQEDRNEAITTIENLLLSLQKLQSLCKRDKLEMESDNIKMGLIGFQNTGVSYYVGTGICLSGQLINNHIFNTFLLEEATAEEIRDLSVDLIEEHQKISTVETVENENSELKEENSVLKEELNDTKKELIVTLSDLFETKKELEEIKKKYSVTTEVINALKKPMSIAKPEVTKLEAPIKQIPAQHIYSSNRNNNGGIINRLTLWGVLNPPTKEPDSNTLQNNS